MAIAQQRHEPPQQDVVYDGDPFHGAQTTSVTPMLAHNVELKALDPDPERSLAVCRELGAEDRGRLRQRDTYFRARTGRLKLREEEPGGATLVQYDRPDGAHARESRYRLVRVADADGLREALDAALGTLVVVEKERHLWLWDGVRIHLDRVSGLGTFVELEDVRGDGTARVARLSDALGIAPEHVLADSYSDRLLGADALIAAARAVMEHAHAPYSRFYVGAALRADDGSIHVGANVENVAYPQGQCAEASALGALVAAGRTRVVEAAVIATGEAACVPCGGCRQRLREFMDLEGTVHLCSESGVHETATLQELLPRSFGPEALRRSAEPGRPSSSRAVPG
jgi:homotetrameric cytidine deaminase